jgi:glucosamine-phosphate N-acetyltransferase
LFATLYILQVLNMTVQDWKKLYTEKHTKMSKIEVQDKNRFICNANELELIEPAYVQDYIERLCASQQAICRAFVRASGTENVVRLFVESENSGIMELVHWKITSYIKQKMTDVVFHIKNTSFSLRALRLQDLGDNYFTLLGQLSVMDIEKMDADQSAKLFRRFGDHHQIHVLEEKDSGSIVGTGTLFIEDKFLRNYGKVGHIEDIVVHSDYRGYGLGKIMIEHLTKQAKSAGCYKCILDCSDDNVGFYEKCGYVKKGAQMGAYF